MLPVINNRQACENSLNLGHPVKKTERVFRAWLLETAAESLIFILETIFQLFCQKLHLP
jgi:hypothetical protein